ncbi:hypothetical protein AB0302_05200 [Micrococcus sp. NPDC078436]|uniref:hypothetical protein n=1 Tax=Micrococcus sp. NPDC078436 TaxID=3154960 RepID=UPI003261F924
MITLSGLSLVLSAAAVAASTAPLPAAPEPTLRPGLEEADVTPGIEGFLFTALMVAMAVIVLRLMVRSVRRVQQRSPQAEAMLVDRHQRHLPEEVREGGEHLDADAEDRLERLRAKYPGYLAEPTPEPKAPDTGRP